MATVFYSWQSDIKPIHNKFKRALEIAVKQIGEGLEEAERPELDSDTQGTFASVKIVETILKKIDACAVFVADVTPIAEVGDKLVPNPNVMAELGYALKSKSEYSLFVFCHDGERPERNMPFDIWGNNLLRVRSTDKPSDIAKELGRRIQGMLATASDNTQALDHPYVYIVGAAFNSASDGASAILTIKNSEQEEYFLDYINIEGKIAWPNRSLAADDITRGILVPGITQIFANPNPVVKMVLKRGGREYYIRQEIETVRGADEQNHFQQFVQRPIIVQSFG